MQNRYWDPHFQTYIVFGLKILKITFKMIVQNMKFNFIKNLKYCLRQYGLRLKLKLKCLYGVYVIIDWWLGVIQLVIYNWGIWINLLSEPTKGVEQIYGWISLGRNRTESKPYAAHGLHHVKECENEEWDKGFNQWGDFKRGENKKEMQDITHSRPSTDISCSGQVGWSPKKIKRKKFGWLPSEDSWSWHWACEFGGPHF